LLAVYCFVCHRLSRSPILYEEETEFLTLVRIPDIFLYTLDCRIFSLTEKIDKDQSPDLPPPIEQEELSLEGKMFLAVRGYSRAISVTKVVAIFSLFMLVMILWDVYDIFVMIDENETIDAPFTIYGESLADFLSNTLSYIFAAMISLGGIVVWSFVKGNSRRKELRKLIRDYVTQSYYFTFSSSTHGKDNIAMDFFNIAEGVFPELQREELKNLKKTGKEWEVEGLTVEGAIYEGEAETKSLGDYEFDVCAKTSDGFFVIKEFKKDQVSYEDLHEAIWTAAKNIPESRKDIFRIVCLANSFSKEAVDRHIDLEKSFKDKIPVDLIVIRKKGFSVVKISRLHSKD